MRALQSNRVLAGLVGVRVKRVDTWAWTLAGLIAGLAMLAHGYFQPDTPLWLLDAAGMAVALNAVVFVTRVSKPYG